MKFLPIILGCIICGSGANVVLNQITGVTTNNLMFTGFIPVSDSSTSNLFFTFYGRDGETDQSKLKSYPLIIAVSNPGSSSQYLNLGGIGPMTLKTDMTLVKNQLSATTFSNVLFIDSLGSGFSFASSKDEIPTTHKAFGQQLTYAINLFISQADIGKSQDVYLVGQSTFLRTVPGLDDIDPLKSVIHLGAWPDFYALGKYYGVAGIDMKIFSNSERITIQSTFVTCFSYQNNNRFKDAHQCYDNTLNYVESKTKNCNLFNVKLQQNLTDFIPTVMYYFIQSATVAQYKAPNTTVFEGQSSMVSENLYTDMGKNYDKDISQYLKDQFSVKQVFVVGQDDYISYSKAIRNWLENDITFVESDSFKNKKLQDYQIEGKTVGYTKAVTQIAYYELFSSGHYIANNQPSVLIDILQKQVSKRQLKLSDQ